MISKRSLSKFTKNIIVNHSREAYNDKATFWYGAVLPQHLDIS